MEKKISFQPNKRPTIHDIINQMNDFEKIENVPINYNAKEKKHKEIIKKLFHIKNEPENVKEEKKIIPKVTIKMSNKIIPKIDSDDCENCLKNHICAIKLDCNHTLCIDCTMKWIIKRLKLGLKYDEFIDCIICKKKKGIGILLY